jgi:hypothetical protein
MILQRLSKSSHVVYQDKLCGNFTFQEQVDIKRGYTQLFRILNVQAFLRIFSRLTFSPIVYLFNAFA